MFFLLSKLLLNLIFPFSWICILVLFALIVKRPALRKKYLVSAFVLLNLFSNPMLLKLFVNFWDIDTVQKRKNYSCAIVLGGFASEDDNEQGYFNTSADRFLQGIRLKLSGQANNLLFTGGNASIRPTGFREANWIATEIKHYGIPDSSVIIEQNSRNTLENAIFTKQLLEKHQLKPPYLLVTSAFHMRRSIMTFNRVGLQTEPYPCNYLIKEREYYFKDLIPEAWVLSTWNFYIKEVIGYSVYYVKTYNR